MLNWIFNQCDVMELTRVEWEFTNGKAAFRLQELKKLILPLERVRVHISRVISTSANPI